MLKLTAPTTSKPAAGDEMIAMETMLDPARKRPAAVVRGKPAAASTKIAVIRTRPAACAAAVATAAA